MSKRPGLLSHEFVEYVPNQLEEGKLYISVRFATTVHRCCCGCGNEVVAPLSPTDWKLTFDGQTISLYPSIGNWSFPCESHYWIDRNRVIWGARWSRSQIEASRAQDRAAKEAYFAAVTKLAGSEEVEKIPAGGWRNWLRSKLGRWIG